MCTFSQHFLSFQSIFFHRINNDNSGIGNTDKTNPSKQNGTVPKKSHLILSCPDFGLNANFLQPFSLSVGRNSSCSVCAVSRSRLQFARQVTKNILKKRKSRIIAVIHYRLYFSELPWLQVESIWNLNRTTWKAKLESLLLDWLVLSALYS